MFLLNYKKEGDIMNLFTEMIDRDCKMWRKRLKICEGIFKWFMVVYISIMINIFI